MTRSTDGTVKEPLNREAKTQDLTANFITKNDDAYDRNHGPIQHLDASTHKVHIDGLVTHSTMLSIESLRTLPQQTITAALQCAGNRRDTMAHKAKEVWGISWGEGAVMNCVWSGPLLCDILESVKPTIEHGHVAFSCHQTEVQEDDYYGGSIPLARAMDRNAEVILALDMNNAPLTPERGFPVRVVIPGVAGARAVKWLDKITVQEVESGNKYQQRDYKILPPEVETKEQAEEWWDKVPALEEMPVNSIISEPKDGDEIDDPRDKELVIKGYALPGGSDGPVVKVEVSDDEGKTWKEAEIIEKGTKYSWVLWRFRYNGEVEESTRFWSKATDKGGNTQDRIVEWNLRGLGYNGYGELMGLKVKERLN